MITVNMHEAKTRLSELVKAVEERNEIVVLCRDGREVAEIRRRAKRRQPRNLAPDPRFRVEFAPGYRPTEPLAEDEWPEDLRLNGSLAPARRWHLHAAKRPAAALQLCAKLRKRAFPP